MAGPSRASTAALLFTVFLDLLGFGMVLPILALYAEHFEVSDLAVTSLGATYSLMQLIFSPIWGRVSDRYGRRPVLLVSILGSCGSQLGYALAPGFAWLLLARAFAGVCGANVSAAQAYMADATDEKDRAAAMGSLGAATGLGFVLGPVMGGVLGHYDPRLPFLVASCLAAANFVLAYLTLREPRAAHERAASRSITWSGLWHTVSSPRLRSLIIVFCLIMFGMAQLEGTFPLYLERRFGFGRRDVGYVFGGIGATMVFTQGLLVRRLASRLGERVLLIGGALLMACGMALCFSVHQVWLLALGVGAVAMGNGLSMPALSSLISRSAGRDQQGGVLGASQSFGALARVGGPICGGWLLAFGDGTPYLAAAAIMMAAAGFARLAVGQPGLPAAAAAPPA